MRRVPALLVATASAVAVRVIVSVAAWFFSAPELVLTVSLRCAVVRFTAAAMLLLLAGMAVRVAARGRAVSSGALTGSTQSSSLVARHGVCSVWWRGQSGHSSPPPRCLRPTLVTRAHPHLQAFLGCTCVRIQCSRLPGPFLRTIVRRFFPPCSSLFSFLLLSSSRTLSPFVIKLLGPSTRARAQAYSFFFS